MIARKDGKERWRGRMTRKDDNISFYALNHLHLTPYCLRSRKIFPAVRTIYALSTYRGMRLSFLERHRMAWSLSGWLDAIEHAFPLCSRQPCYRYWSWLLARWQRLTFGMSLVLVRAYWLDNKRAPLECHRVWWQKTDTSKPSLRQDCG